MTEKLIYEFDGGYTLGFKSILFVYEDRIVI